MYKTPPLSPLMDLFFVAHAQLCPGERPSVKTHDIASCIDFGAMDRSRASQYYLGMTHDTLHPCCTSTETIYLTHHGENATT